MSPDNLSSKDSTESKILDLLEILPLLAGAALSTLVGYQLQPMLPAVSRLIWVVIWIVSTLIYALSRNAPARMNGSLVIFAVSGGFVLRGSAVDVKLTWVGLVFAGWLGFAGILFFMRYRSLQSAAWLVELISGIYMLGWVYLFLQDLPVKTWSIWSILGGCLFAFWIAVKLRTCLRQSTPPVLPAAGDLYMLSFNLYLVSVISVHCWLSLQ